MVLCKVSVNFQVEADAVRQTMAIDVAVPQPAAVQIEGILSLNRKVAGTTAKAVRFSPVKASNEPPGKWSNRPSDAGRYDVYLGFRLDGGAPFAVAARAVGEHAEFDRLERVDHTGRLGHGQKSVLVAADSQLSILHDPTSEMSAASTA